MDFPTYLNPPLTTRAGRMLAAGRVKVTLTQDDGQHITILLKCFADNRNRQYTTEVRKNWVPCPCADASHVFVEVPNASGEWNDKVGTLYPKSGKFYTADNADPRRVKAAAIIAHWLNDPMFMPSGVSEIVEQSECAMCGLELTDPVSIARGIGPVCLGKMTGSQHQVKEAIEQVTQAQDEQASATMVTPAPGEVGSREWIESLPKPGDDRPLTPQEMSDLNMADMAEVECDVNVHAMSNRQLQILAAAATEEAQIRVTRARDNGVVGQDFLAR